MLHRERVDTNRQTMGRGWGEHLTSSDLQRRLCHILMAMHTQIRVWMRKEPISGMQMCPQDLVTVCSINPAVGGEGQTPAISPLCRLSTCKSRQMDPDRALDIKRDFFFLVGFAAFQSCVQER